MRPLRRFVNRLGGIVGKQSGEDRLRAEIEDHIALQTAENIQFGMPEKEARRQALLKFGAAEALREAWRQERGLPFLETLFRDVRQAVRRLRLAPAYTITTVLILALGIGATTSIFTLVNAILLESLPVAHPDELYRLGRESRCCYTGGYSQDREFSLVSYELYQYLRDHTRGFADLAAFPAASMVFGVRRSGAREAAESYPGEFVSGNYFRMLGIHASAGRLLTSDDDRPDAAPAAVMSYRVWKQQYGSDASVVGSVFNLNDKPFTVVGIAPAGFFGDTLRAAPPDFFVPLNMEPVVDTASDLSKYDTHWLNLIGRLQPGAKPAAIEAEMRIRLQEWLHSHEREMNPNDRARMPEQTLNLAPGGAGITSLRDKYERWLEILMAVTGFVLLIACANLANLTLVRGMERRRETSLSMALGASRVRVIRQVLTESVLVSMAGGLASLAIAFGGARLMLHFAFPSTAGAAFVPGIIPIDASPSIPVLAFAFAASFVTAIAFGAAPAWMATRTDPIEALRGRRVATSARPLSGKLLVILQAALALVLLSAAGLLTAALEKIETQDFGFDQNRRIVARINPQLAAYESPQLPLLYRRIHDSLAAIPGVESIALALYGPQTGGAWGAAISIEGHALPGPRDDPLAQWDRVTDGYFETIGTPVVMGRGITARDTASSPKAAVISEAFARKFFRGEDPIGRRFIRLGSTDGLLQIVGIVRDARYSSRNIGGPAEPFFFTAAAQADYTQRNIGALFLKDIIVVARPGVRLAEGRIRQAMAAVDPSLPIVSIRGLDKLVTAQFTQERSIARLASFFGVLALILASVGLYGATAYNAGRRAKEVGIRMALGAGRGEVVRLVLRGALSLIVPGVIAGLPLAIAAGRLLQHQLYGVSPSDPEVMLIAVAALSGSAVVAASLPAWRAGRVMPMEALRVE